ncbi:MAG TPA: hypothetical protein VHR45_05050 [Thermoanaerobaculia bacterium]|nr:hypothetical protein [Thermoanaerobaculia bacterium]
MDRSPLPRAPLSSRPPPGEVGISALAPAASPPQPAPLAHPALLPPTLLADRLPVVAAVEMGFGHLRAGHALATALGTELVRLDQPPLAGPEEQRLWRTTRRLYEVTARVSQLPIAGAPLRALLDSLTSIPHLYPKRDLSAPTLQARSLDRLIRKGLGRGLMAHLEATGAPLLTTFFAAAVLADEQGWERTYCVVTDVDLNRVWVPLAPARSRIVYLTPSRRALDRLRAYGVPRAQIEYTGFPLPAELLGGPALDTLRRNLAARLVRLDRHAVFRGQARGEIQQFLGEELPADQQGRAPLATFTVGGAGAQARLARALLRSLAPLVAERRLRLCLAAGVRPEIAARFRRWVEEAGLEERLGDGVTIFQAESLESYFPSFNSLLAETDILWTKPSEMTFFGALGIPLVFSQPVGIHERYNRRWAIENGAGLKQRDPRFAGDWLREWLSEGTLAAAAWSGFMRLPKFGLFQILERMAGVPQPAAAHGKPGPA